MLSDATHDKSILTSFIKCQNYYILVLPYAIQNVRHGYYHAY